MFRPFKIVSLTVLLMVFSTSAFAQQDTKALEAFLTASKATPQQREAYTFAYQHPEVLKSIPCYCGCLRRGHKDNYNCFLQDSASAKRPAFEFHGMECPMCVQIALVSKQLYDKHRPLPEIRNYIDKMYQQYPQLNPTPTPKP